MKKTIVVSLFFLLAGCSAQPSNQSSLLPVSTFYDYQIYTSETAVSLPQLVDNLERADVILVGEWHSHAGTHRFQADLLASMHQSSANIALAMEQFSRDQQSLVNEYLNGEIGEQILIKQGNAWPNYTSDYRPLIEFARQHHLDVLAANAPKKIVKCIGRKGLAWVKNLSKEERGFIATNIDTSDSPYKQKFMASMHHGKPEKNANLYAAQVSWDETMADSIVRYLSEHSNAKILLTAGKFHVADGLGIAASIKRRNPALNIAIIEPVTEVSSDKQGHQLLVKPLPPRYIKKENKLRAYHQLGQRNSDLNCESN